MMAPVAAPDPSFFLLSCHGCEDFIKQDVFSKLCRHLLAESFNRWFSLKPSAAARSYTRRNPSRVEDVYRVNCKKLGEGRFGIVYAATHRITGERWVCKKVRKQIGTRGRRSEDVLREINSVASIDHPNIIKVHEYFEDADAVCQIMELCEGGDLQELIDAAFHKKTIQLYSEAFMKDVMRQTFQALACVHRKGLVHRDLKPQNIMLLRKHVAGASTCSIKLIDFGLAEHVRPDRRHLDHLGGTPLYMAPEAFRLELTTKSDIWSAGVILYNLATGDYPFMAQWPVPNGLDRGWWLLETCKQIQDVDKEHKFNPRLSSVSDHLVDFLCETLRKDPELRYDAPGCLRHSWLEEFETDRSSRQIASKTWLETLFPVPWYEFSRF